MAWEIIFIIGKPLERRCPKWAHMTHLDIWNTSYGQKKGRELNWQFDSQTTKSQESTRFSCMQAACDIPLESSQRGLQLYFRPRLHRRFARKVMAPQSCGSPNLSDFESPKTKSHLDVSPVERRGVYYKGEGGGFPQVRAVVSLVNPSCPWFVLAPKVLQLHTNHLVLVLAGLCE
jgi:hypothetical protein